MEHNVEVGRLVSEKNVEVLSVAPHGQISEKICGNIVEVPVTQVAEQFVARCAEHVVALPVLLVFEQNAEVVSLAPHGRMREQIVQVSVPQDAESWVARVVAVKRRRQGACLGECMVCLDLSQVF